VCRSSSCAGVPYGSGGNNRWHECSRGTAFKTQWKNTAVHQLACFPIMRNSAVWRWSHTRHDTDTIIVSRNPEIITTRPPQIVRVRLNFLGTLDFSQSF